VLRFLEMTAKKGGLDRAARALATADTVAHAAFLVLFGWRSLTSFGPLRFVAGGFALLALLGIALAFVGGLLAKYGRRTPAARVGYWSIAGSTGLAAVLLAFASWT
jgi:hypothetical protein